MVRKRRLGTGALVALLIGLALVGYLAYKFLMREFVIASYYIPSKAMEPTLHQGDLVLAEKLSFRVLHREPQRGEIVIFVYPDRKPAARKVDYIKRCIGLPGDTVEIAGGQLFVNGHVLSEPYIAEPCASDYGPVTIPADSYLMLGDNRNRSYDSRYWGYVPRANLIGSVTEIYWPLSNRRSF